MARGVEKVKDLITNLRSGYSPESVPDRLPLETEAITQAIYFITVTNGFENEQGLSRVVRLVGHDALNYEFESVSLKARTGDTIAPKDCKLLLNCRYWLHDEQKEQVDTWMQNFRDGQHIHLGHLPLPDRPPPAADAGEEEEEEDAEENEEEEEQSETEHDLAVCVSDDDVPLDQQIKKPEIQFEAQACETPKAKTETDVDFELTEMAAASGTPNVGLSSSSIREVSSDRLPSSTVVAMATPRVSLANRLDAPSGDALTPPPGLEPTAPKKEKVLSGPSGPAKRTSPLESPDPRNPAPKPTTFAAASSPSRPPRAQAPPAPKRARKASTGRDSITMAAKQQLSLRF